MNTARRINGQTHDSIFYLILLNYENLFQILMHINANRWIGKKKTNSIFFFVKCCGPWAGLKDKVISDRITQKRTCIMRCINQIVTTINVNYSVNITSQVWCCFLLFQTQNSSSMPIKLFIITIYRANSNWMHNLCHLSKWKCIQMLTYPERIEHYQMLRSRQANINGMELNWSQVKQNENKRLMQYKCCSKAHLHANLFSTTNTMYAVIMISH